MPALSPPERHALPRFLEPDDIDPQWVLTRAGVLLALDAFWAATSDCTKRLDKLDKWAARHDAVADAGEAREEAVAEIVALTALMNAACETLEHVLAFAESRPA